MRNGNTIIPQQTLKYIHTHFLKPCSVFKCTSVCVPTYTMPCIVCTCDDGSCINNRYTHIHVLLHVHKPIAETVKTERLSVRKEAVSSSYRTGSRSYTGPSLEVRKIDPIATNIVYSVVQPDDTHSTTEWKVSGGDSVQNTLTSMVQPH